MKRCLIRNQLLLFVVLTAAVFFSQQVFSQVKEEWVRTYNEINGNDGPGDMVVDRNGNVYVTGFVQTSIRPYATACTTIKYDSGGHQQWIKFFQYNDPDETLDWAFNNGAKIRIGEGGNLYVFGTSKVRDPIEDIYVSFVIKYDSLGSEQWSKTVSSGYAVDIALDSAGNVYTTSQLPDAFCGCATFITSKLDRNGKHEWQTRYDDQFPLRGLGLKSIQADKEGNSYVGALTSGVDFTDHDQFGFSIIKYNPVGAEQWNHRYLLDSIRMVRMDADDNFLSVGTISSSELLFMKFSKDGELIWKTNVQSKTSPSNLTLDQSGNVYTTGIGAGGLNTIKISANGTFQWKTAHTDSTDATQDAKDIVTDSLGNCYVLVETYVPFFRSTDIVTLKYTANGIQQWVQRYDGPAKIDDHPSAVRVGPPNSVFVSGASAGIGTGQDFVTIKYKETPEQFGVCCFDDGFGPRAKCGSNVTALNCSKSGKDAFFAGSVSDCSLIDTATLCGKTPSIVNINASYLENERSVKVSWQRKESSLITGYYIQRSSDGKSFKSIGFMPANASGNYLFTDPYPEIENYYKLVWFEKNGHESNMVLALALQRDRMQLLPNPATSIVRIVLNNMDRFDSRLTVTDNTGRIKLSRHITKGTRPELDVSSLSAGIYFIRIEQNGKIYREKLVKQ